METWKMAKNIVVGDILTDETDKGVEVVDVIAVSVDEGVVPPHSIVLIFADGALVFRPEQRVYIVELSKPHL